MLNAYRIRDLKTLSPGERTAKLNSIVGEAVAPINGQAATINAKIDGYEARFGVKSAQLGECLRTNKLAETREVVDWLFWLRVRELSGG